MKNKLFVMLGVFITVIVISTVIAFSSANTGAVDVTAKTKAIELGADVSEQLKAIAGSPFFVTGGEKIAFHLADETVEIDSLHQAEIHAIAVSPDQKMMVSGDKAGKVLVWNLIDGTLVELAGAHKDDVKDIDFSADGSFFTTAGKDRLIKIWDTASLVCSFTLKGHKSYVLSTDITVDGTMIASVGMDNSLVLWDVASGKKVKEKKDSHYRAVNQVAFTADGKSLVTASADTFMKVWDVESLSCLNTIKGHINEVLCIALNADGTAVYSTGRDKLLYKFSLADGSLLGSVDLANNVYAAGLMVTTTGTIVAADKSGELTTVKDDSFTLISQEKLMPMTALGAY